MSEQILRKSKNILIWENILCLIILMSYIISFLLGFKILGLGGFYQTTKSVQVFNTISLSMLYNFIGHYIIILEICSVLSLFGFIELMHRISYGNNSIVYSFMVTLGFFLCFISVKIDYAILFIFPFECFLATLGLRLISNNNKHT